jgi:hypothetical protein
MIEIQVRLKFMFEKVILTIGNARVTLGIFGFHRFLQLPGHSLPAPSRLHLGFDSLNPGRVVGLCEAWDVKIVTGIFGHGEIMGYIGNEFLARGFF